MSLTKFHNKDLETSELSELAWFMSGPDMVTLGRMIGFFSSQGNYLHPRELKVFWESLTETEKMEYRVAL